MSFQPCVFIVDDDYAVRDSLGHVMETAGLSYRSFESAKQFLQTYSPGEFGCLLLDLHMPDMTGDELQAELLRRNLQIPIIFLTAYGDIPTTVQVIKAGAVDFLSKPIASKLLVERIRNVLQQQRELYEKNQAEHAASRRIESLTARELDVMRLVVAGFSNKQIARQLGISFRTVEVHRARVMEKTGANNLLDLARIGSNDRNKPSKSGQ